ncbi:glyoxalase/bleomycin resistance/extradiol dioxygenase family protein [Mumia sp. zg.B21]|uniref:VOC family protein n=1 Tax=Mumia sp. zg.B21 TaxID=2855447 RepID=UPI001C6DFBB2|nr:VOC family protein [Mumia sp. zg.B21]MBW9210721.1 glyoxalase/bleomycin resistance/extradiol dioxygenase family protein [Mumia sp. zg.B21]
MTLTSFYPVLGTHDVAEAATYYEQWFGFRRTFTSDWYVSLERDGYELALLDPDHPTVPGGYGVPARGTILNVEVDDVDTEYARLVTDGGLTPVLELRSEPFGQRHFILDAPGGILVDVITPIPPSSAYAEAFDSEQRADLTSS